MATPNHSLDNTTLAVRGLLSAGACGIDAGMTMLKVARATSAGIEVSASETSSIDHESWRGADGPIGLTGARARLLAGLAHALTVPEIDAAARGCVALLSSDNRLGDGEFLMALLGTGTAFAVVRDGVVQHLGGTALGGGSFAGIAQRVAPELSYDEAIEAAACGDRREVDVMVADVYPDGIGRIGPELTAAHLARKSRGTTADFLSGLLNLHGESIAMIAAGRARMANASRIVLCGGFVHNNHGLVTSISAMAARFGHTVEVVMAPGYAGALGAALIASDTARA